MVLCMYSGAAVAVCTRGARTPPVLHTSATEQSSQRSRRSGTPVQVIIHTFLFFSITKRPKNICNALFYYSSAKRIIHALLRPKICDAIGIVCVLTEKGLYVIETWPIVA